ncbi:MAG: hypothetical protein U5L02_16395 [Rheinheimera sp.]|nr:hypothetical protein [Rheinheimera sp.]
MNSDEFKSKAASAAGECDFFDLCLTYLRSVANNENQPVALKAMDIYEEVMA